MSANRRDLLKIGSAIVAAGMVGSRALADSEDPKASAPAVSDEKKPSPDFRVQRLSWAGIKIVYKDTTILLDPWISVDTWGGAWKGKVVPVTAETDRRHVLLSHVHNDHFDPAAVHEVEKGSPFAVICHESKASYVAARGFRVYPVPMYEPNTLGDLTVCAVPAVDGLREFQVSWIVSGGGKRIIHCGDTLWHGSFWYFGEQYGPFDAAFLPINGAKMTARQPFSDVNASMTPTHAVAAAVVMRAKLAVPIHHGLNDPGVYMEHPNAVEEFRAVAEKRGQSYKFMEPAEWMTL